MRRLAGRILLLACALTAAVTPALAGTHPPDRNGFMIGFGVGGGGASLDGSDREGGATGNFRIGYALRPDVVLHYEGAAWTRTFDEPAGDVTWSFSTNAAALTYYPPQSGLFVRGGIGFGTARVEVKTGNVKVSHDETGLGLLAAAGWEFRLTRKFALAPQLGFAYQTLDGLDNSNFVDVSLGFNWYW